MRTPPSISVARSCITTVSAPARHDAAGEDAHGLARSDRAPGGLARERIADALQRRLAVRLQGRRSGRPSRPSRSCRGPARRPATTMSAASTRSSALRTCTRSVAVDRRQELADERARTLDRHRVGVVVVGAGNVHAGSGEWSWRTSEFANRDFSARAGASSACHDKAATASPSGSEQCEQPGGLERRASAASASAAAGTSRRTGRTSSRPSRLNAGHRSRGW